MKNLIEIKVIISVIIIFCAGCGGKHDEISTTSQPPLNHDSPSPNPAPADMPIGSIPENSSIAILTTENYKIALSRAYRTLIDGAILGYLGNGPDQNAEVCTSGTQSYRLIDNDADRKPSKNDEIEKNYSSCIFTAVNGSQNINGSIRYQIQEASLAGSATKWTSSGSISLIDKTSDKCSATGKCIFSNGGKFIKNQSGTTTTLEMSDGPHRNDWLGSSDMYLTALSSRLILQNKLDGKVFEIYFTGSVGGTNLFGPAVNRNSTNTVSLMITTVSNFIGSTNSDDGHATSGKMRLDGDKSKARLTVNSSAVLLELDKDNDGSFETTETLDWPTFLQL